MSADKSGSHVELRMPTRRAEGQESVERKTAVVAGSTPRAPPPHLRARDQHVDLLREREEGDHDHLAGQRGDGGAAGRATRCGDARLDGMCDGSATQGVCRGDGAP